MLTDEALCPGCGALYLLDDDAIVPPGLFLKCAACGTSWRAGKTPVSAPRAATPVEAGTADDLPPILSAPDPLMPDAPPAQDGWGASEVESAVDDPHGAPAGAPPEGVPSVVSFRPPPSRRRALRTEPLPRDDEDATWDAGADAPSHPEGPVDATSDGGTVADVAVQDSAARRRFAWPVFTRKPAAAAGVTVDCPGCGTTYRVRQDDAWAEGRLVECAKCHHAWFEAFSTP
jgi:predicted Zn finger-like uncharacterized protein